MTEASIGLPPEQSSNQPNFAEEMQKNHPEAYERLNERTVDYVKAIKAYAESSNEHSLAGFPEGTESILPKDETERDEVFKKIGDGFTDFVLRTQEPVIRKAETEELSPSQSQEVRVQIAMGVYVPDKGRALDRTLDLITNGHNTWIEELYEVPHNPDAIKELAQRSPEDRAIESVGLLLAARLNQNVSAAMGDLPRRDMPKHGITTTDGKSPVDIADTILRSAGAHPFPSSQPQTI